ncbi:phage head closure protein [Diplocloster modestus]|uniref:Phage head closure protein n=1 Tax=Diplocloster modestus TaxID=2850322 RepID=A0ABS6KCM1_9FIRM|nr:phage head closure protein [Diplocloster modestus]MBU9728272.1 phage head closure protein [Diplocloster modestus]
MPNRKGKFEEFNDGVMSVYRVNEEDNIIPKLDYEIRYGEEVVSIKRHYGAKAVGEEIVKSIHVQLMSEIDTHDIVIIDGRQYEIEQIQPDKSTLPPILRISLTKLETHREKKMDYE